MNTLNHGFEYQRHLGSEAAGLQVIEYLTLCYAAFTREEWLARINAGRVLLDGVPVQEHQILKPGQLLSWMRPPWKEPEVPRSFAILYQDNCLLAVAKPSGTTHSSRRWLLYGKYPFIACPPPFSRGQSGASTGSRHFRNCLVSQ